MYVSGRAAARLRVARHVLDETTDEVLELSELRQGFGGQLDVFHRAVRPYDERHGIPAPCCAAARSRGDRPIRSSHVSPGSVV